MACYAQILTSATDLCASIADDSRTNHRPACAPCSSRMPRSRVAEELSLTPVNNVEEGYSVRAVLLSVLLLLASVAGPSPAAAQEPPGRLRAARARAAA